MKSYTQVKSKHSKHSKHSKCFKYLSDNRYQTDVQDPDGSAFFQHHQNPCYK